jgi:NAD(P)H dehydrogenase (quinone)
VLLAGGHDRAVYEITGGETFTADELAALYGKLGGRAVRARALDDAEFVATLSGGGAADDHRRYGAELVASFGRSIREGYMESCTDDVARLTGRRPLTLAQVLAPVERRD